MYIGPAILSKPGKIFIIVVFLTLTGLTSYACSQVRVDFSMEDYLMDKESLLFKYHKAKRSLYSDFGEVISYYTYNATNQWLSEDN